jgi:superfamily II DNA helicase RecQ
MPREWTVKEICDLVTAKLGKHPCWLQIKIALALHAIKDVVGVAATGAGKTLSFWIALLMALEEGEDKMIFVVTPLNLLGKQNVEALDKAGLSAIAVSSENANPTTFKVR